MTRCHPRLSINQLISIYPTSLPLHEITQQALLLSRELPGERVLAICYGSLHLHVQLFDPLQQGTGWRSAEQIQLLPIVSHRTHSSTQPPTNAHDMNSYTIPVLP